MRIVHFILLTTYCFMIFSCKQIEKKETVVNPEWNKLILRNGWILFAPKNFTTKTAQGIDTSPGSIQSIQDSILLNYDSGHRSMGNKKCRSFRESLEMAKKEIEDDFYNQVGYIDTIDNKVAIIYLAKNSTDYTRIEISDCKSGLWLTIYGLNFNEKQERLVLDIFQSIKLKG